MKTEFFCEECNTEYELLNSEDKQPEYCPYCGNNFEELEEEDDDYEEEEWDDQDRDNFS